MLQGDKVVLKAKLIFMFAIRIYHIFSSYKQLLDKFTNQCPQDAVKVISSDDFAEPL